MNLKISIITPSLNQGKYIEENILSIINQNYPNFEHIIVDGGSTDDTMNILKKYPHLIWTSEPDNGQPHAVNKGLKKATGDVVGWFNSDDRVPEGSFNKVNEYFNNNPIEIAVVGDQVLIDGNSNILKLKKSREYTFDYLLNTAKGITQNSVYFKRQILNKIGYIDESFIYSMDRDFFIRLARIMPIKYINEPLGEFRLHTDSKTSEGTYKFSLEHLKIRKKYGGKFLSKSHRNDLYVILTQPLREIKFIRNQVQKFRKR